MCSIIIGNKKRWGAIMKIIVAGCGKIGSTIVSSLVKEGHDVTAIDNNDSVISDIVNFYDVMGICGNGADCETLTEAGVEGTELFVSVTGSDELNMLSCFIAKQMGAKHTIARIRNPEYNDASLGFMKQTLGLSMAINPEFLAAKELFNIIKLPAASKVETFSRRNFEMIELRLKSDSILDGMSIIDIRKKIPNKFLICAVQRDDNIYIPDGNFVLKSGDRIGVTAPPTEFIKLFKNLKITQKQARNVMILGASTTAFYLAKMLTAAGNNVKIVERDLARSTEFAEALPSAVMINGDGAQQEILLEEGIASTDAFVSLTGLDELNILVSYFASSKNVPKVIAKVNRDEFSVMAEKLGLDCIVSPKDITADILVRYARALNNSLGSNMETLYKFMDAKAEATEFIISSDSNIIGVPLKDMKLKKNTLISGIIRDRKAIIPSGDDMILPGDHIVIITAGYSVMNASDILS